MSASTHKLARAALGYGVLGVSLYLTYLTGSDDFSLSGYAFAFLVIAIYIAFEKHDELIEALEIVTELRHGGDDGGD